MPNVVYPNAREGFLSADIDMVSDDIRALLVDLADYAYSPAHTFLTDVPVAARVAASGALSSTTVTDGVFDAADTTVTGVAGDTVECVIVYQHTGSDATARLISFHDSGPDGTTPLALTPDGGNVVITWPVAGIFSI